MEKIDEILKLLTSLSEKVNNQEVLIKELQVTNTKKEELKTEEPKKPDVLEQQKMLAEARKQEANQLATTKAMLQLEQFLEKNNTDFTKIKEIVGGQETTEEKLKELEKAVFFTINPINEENTLQFGKLKGSFAEEGTGINLTITDLIKKTAEKEENAPPSYFASGGKDFTKENILDKLKVFYSKMATGGEEKPLPTTISKELLTTI